jgi:hypothetical protein
MMMFKMIFTILISLQIGSHAESRPLKCQDLLNHDSRHQIALDNLVYWGLTTAGALASLPAWAGGGFSGSGGGGGIISTPSQKNLKTIKNLIRNNQALTPELLREIQVKSLERWELEQDSLDLLAIPEHTRWQEILAIVHQRVRIISPIIADKLVQLSQWMKFEDWQAATSLPQHKDFKLNYSFKEDELFVSLALRLSEGNNLSIQGPSRRNIKLHVIYNSELFAQLEPIDQSILVFHEQLYALAQASGHTTSDEIRPLVKLFFSDYFNSISAQSQNGILASPNLIFFKNKMNLVFGDYTVYFSNSTADQTLVPGSARSTQRHLYVFHEVIEKLRLQMADQDQKIPQHLRAENSFLGFSKDSTLTPEQAFIFMIYFFLEKTLREFNAESLMDIQIDTKTHEKRLKIACELLKIHADQLVAELPALRLAMIYCE